MGNPVLENPQGNEIAGRPARFVEIVKMSLKYIEIGSFDFSPDLKAGFGAVGVIIASTFSKALRKSCRIKVLTFWALR